MTSEVGFINTPKAKQTEISQKNNIADKPIINYAEPNALEFFNITL